MSNIDVKIRGKEFECLIYMDELDVAQRSELNLLATNVWDDLSYHPTIIKLPWYRFKRLLPILGSWCKSSGIKINFDTTLNGLISEFAKDKKSFRGQGNKPPLDVNNIQSILNNNNFSRTLTEKQKRDVFRLVELRHGANFSVPGAGKTTSILATHTILKSFKNVDKMFVICPINAFISWEDEVEEIFGGKLSVCRLNKNLIENFSQQGLPDADIYISNYEKYRGSINGILKLFAEYKIHVVLDESHRVKSGFANQSFAQIVQLGDCSIRRDIMSGTPMPQSYMDINSQFDFLWPTERIAPGNLEEEMASEIIQANIRDLYVRTTKTDLQLEPVKYISTQVEMGPIQRELYSLLRSESARILTSMERKQLNTFRFLGKCVIRLMQASTNPMLLTSGEDIYDEVEGIPPNSEVWDLLEEYSKYEKPAKIEKLRERVKEILGSNRETKILIWSIFVRNILLLKELFSDYNPAVIYGGVSSSGDDTIEESREGQIRKFHEDDTCKVMIANPQACGEGISLHRVCHHAIYLERNYNAAHFLQSMDRIHRFGLKPGTITIIELLQTNNSLDSRIDERLREKIARMSVVLEDPFLERMAYDPFDIEDETGVGIETQDLEDIRTHLLNDE